MLTKPSVTKSSLEATFDTRAINVKPCLFENVPQPRHITVTAPWNLEHDDKALLFGGLGVKRVCKIIGFITLQHYCCLRIFSVMQKPTGTLVALASSHLGSDSPLNAEWKEQFSLHYMRVQCATVCAGTLPGSQSPNCTRHDPARTADA